MGYCALTPSDWLSSFISAGLGLVTGLLTGYFFELRQSRKTKAERDELRIDNTSLRDQVAGLEDHLRRLNVNLTSNVPADASAAGRGQARRPVEDIHNLVLVFVAQRVDASGAVPRSQVYEHFGKTYSSEHVEHALTSLIERGDIELLDKGMVRIAP